MVRATLLVGILLAAAWGSLPYLAQAAQTSEIHITPDGKFTAKNVVVMQKSENGTTFFGRITWDNVFLRVTILTTPNGVAAKITKNNGGSATYAEVKEGDILSIEGTLTPGADSLLVGASAIRDHSLNVEGKTISGTIKTFNKALNNFTLTDKVLGTITVVPPYNIQKGVRTISSSELLVGDKIVSASGAYDYVTKTVTAQSMEVFQDKSVFLPRNFEGTLKSLAATTLPTTLVLTVGKQEYTVYLPTGATVTAKNKTPTTLQRYTIGDTVRLYGSIRPANLFEIDSSVLRNLSF